MGTVSAAEAIPRGSWKGGERWEVGSSTPAGKRRLARDGANLTSSAHLVRVSEINDLGVVRELVLHMWPSRSSVGRKGENLCFVCVSSSADDAGTLWERGVGNRRQEQTTFL